MVNFTTNFKFGAAYLSDALKNKNKNKIENILRFFEEKRLILRVTEPLKSFF